MMNKILEALSNRREVIFTGIGLTGMAGAVILSWKAGTKAEALIEAEKEKQNVEELSKKDIAVSTWKAWAPVVGLYLLSALCIANGERIAIGKNVALTEAYILSTDALKEYKRSVIDSVGKEKEEEIAAGANQRIVAKDSPVHGYIINTGKGMTLCKDSMSGQYFYSEVNAIKEAINDFNAELNDSLSLDSNDLYYRYGINEVTCPTTFIRQDGLLDVYFSTTLTRDNEPCLVINYRNFE